MQSWGISIATDESILSRRKRLAKRTTTLAKRSSAASGCRLLAGRGGARAAGARGPTRLGGTVRLTYGDGTASPRRWLHSGDGVLAQGAAGLVLGYATWPSEIEFEWANGEKHSIPVRPETHDYVVP